MQGRLHAWPNHVVAAEYKRINDNCANYDTYDENKKTKNVFSERVPREERCFHKLNPLYVSKSAKAISESAGVIPLIFNNARITLF
jgi:hypothetical protein